ncbi:MAG: hypothetical protein QW761_00135 [Candidatus Aenigmatarchaeota archaeon]
MEGLVHYLTHWLREKGQSLYPNLEWKYARCIRVVSVAKIRGAESGQSDNSKDYVLHVYLEDVPYLSDELKNHIARKVEMTVGRHYDLFFICNKKGKGFNGIIRAEEMT